MDAAGAELDRLRAEIDRIDADLLDGLLRRAAVVEAIKASKAKAGSLALRPAREAAILRRIVAEADGRFPVPALVCLWREMIAAFTWMQTPFKVAVLSDGEAARVRDAARDHFGALVPLLAVESAAQAMRAISNGEAQLAVLPLPRDGEGWWRWLKGALNEDRLRVLARLPFAPLEGGPRAFLIGRAMIEPTGDDLTLIVIEAKGELSRWRLRERLEAGGFDPHWLAVFEEPGEVPLHLVELRGFVEDCLAVLPEALGPVRGQVLRVQPVGGYARPLEPSPLPF